MKRKFAIVAPLTVATCALFIFGCSDWKRSDPTNVSGTIEQDEARVASRYGGRVERVLAQEGDLLKPGQVIAELDAAELQARHDQAAANLAELKAGPRPEEIAAAKADWEALVAELEFAMADAKRARELFGQKTIPESERDRAVSRAVSLEKNVAAAKARHEVWQLGTRPERIAQAEAQLREIETQLREMSVVAPTNSVLEVLSVKAGDVLSPNREVAALLLPHLWLRVYVPETWLGHIKLGQSVQVRTDSFPQETFTGEVEQISRAAEFTPRNVQTVEERVKQVFGIKIRLPHDQDKLRAGMSADVVFPNVPK